MQRNSARIRWPKGVQEALCDRTLHGPVTYQKIKIDQYSPYRPRGQDERMQIS